MPSRWSILLALGILLLPIVICAATPFANEPVSIQKAQETSSAASSAQANAQPANPTASTQNADAARTKADKDWKSLNEKLRSSSRFLFFKIKARFREYVGGPKATVWPLSQVAAAGLDLALLNGNLDAAKTALADFERYASKGGYNPSEGRLFRQDKFYDDNAWIGLDFLQAYRLTGDKKYLEKARSVLTFLRQGLHADGGLYWKENEKRMSRNTCSNGPAIQLALGLYEISKEPADLAFARNLDKFTYSNLQSPEGLFYDNLGDDGGLDKTIWSYNQGVMIGASVQFYQVSGDRAYLERSRKTALAAMAYFASDDRLWRQPPAFNAVFFRNLLKLEEHYPDIGARKMLTAYLERARSQAYNSETGLYGGGGMGKYTSKEAQPESIDQAAFVQMHALLAMSLEQLRKVS